MSNININPQSYNSTTRVSRHDQITSAIEVDGGLQGDHGLGVVAGLELLQRLVEIGDVRLVVLLVVQLHDVSADVRLQRAIAIVVVARIRSK